MEVSSDTRSASMLVTWSFCEPVSNASLKTLHVLHSVSLQLRGLWRYPQTPVSLRRCRMLCRLPTASVLKEAWPARASTCYVSVGEDTCRGFPRSSAPLPHHLISACIMVALPSPCC